MSKEYTQALDDLFGLVAFQKSLTKEQFRRAQKHFEILESALQRLEAIDNANPSEVLEELEQMREIGNHFWVAEKVNKSYMTIKQALLKAQEPKKYLKWEDLEFKREEQIMKVKLGDNIYTIKYMKTSIEFVFLYPAEKRAFCISASHKQFFNDLHLERVEE